MAYSPKTGLVYIPAQEVSLSFTAQKDFRKHALGYNTGIDFTAPQDPSKAPIKATTGYLLAWDPVAQREAWRVPRDTFGNGGILATAGNLVVQGTGTGFLKVMRSDTGRELWSHWAQTGVLGAPMTYSVRGRQHIAVLAGCGGVYGGACNLVTSAGRKENLDRVLVFALDGKASLPAAAPRTLLTAASYPDKLDPAAVGRGAGHYAQFCAVCHGFGGVSTGNQPDLRFSRLLGVDSWTQIVLHGALEDAGMVNFSSVLNEADAESIRQYVIDLSRRGARGQERPTPGATHSS